MHLRSQSPAHAASSLISELGHGELSPKFFEIVRFLELNPEAAPMPKGKKLLFASIDHLHFMANAFIDSRKPISHPKSTTIPDSMVSFILENYFEKAPTELSRISEEHKMSMVAENMIGNLLERYIAHNLEPNGWIWASGSTIRAVDFILPPNISETSWYALQVKNRDNSENSSSKAIRDGTIIKKWFRTFSKRDATNWENFPNSIIDGSLSESGFRLFVKDSLETLKAVDSGLKKVSS